MIPATILRKHILLAAEWIDKNGDEGRQSKKYDVVINGRQYPPKLVISKAYYYAHGSEWSRKNFTGGEEANSYLKGLGFRIIGKDEALPNPPNNIATTQRCENCGSSIRPDYVFCMGCGCRVKSASDPCDLEPQKANGTAKRTVQHQRLPALERLAIILCGQGYDIGTNNGILVYNSLNRTFMVSEGKKEGGHYLEIVDRHEVGRGVSMIFAILPKEEYSKTLDEVMEGETRYKLSWDEGVLKTIWFYQRRPISQDDVELVRQFDEAVLEIANTGIELRNFIAFMMDKNEEGAKEKGKGGPHDHMYV